MKRIIIFICLSLFSFLNAKEPKTEEQSFSKDKLLDSQNVLALNQEKFQLLQDAEKQNEKSEKKELQKKSGFKAALFSAVIPGAGEFYTESYWKSAIFAALEIVAWTGYLTYTDKGNSKDLQMRRFGDERWSEQRYWTKVYKLANEKGIWDRSSVVLNSETGLLSESDIENNMSYLRDLEETGGFPRFTHSLPETKTQQYYEMIYKYLGQFGAGWVELGQNFDYYNNGITGIELTPDVSHYRSLRNQSNDFYTTAKTMATVVLINHLVSAFDAAFSAKSYNKQLNYSFFAGQKYYAGERVTTYGVALSW